MLAFAHPSLPRVAPAHIIQLSALLRASSLARPLRARRRYWWFVIGFEIFLFAGLLITALLNGLKYMHASWMGLYAVGALLWISMTEAFLTAQDITW